MMYYLFNNWKYAGSYTNEDKAIKHGMNLASYGHSTYIVSADREIVICSDDEGIVQIEDSDSVSRLINLLLAYGELSCDVPDYRIFLLQLGS